MLPSMQQQDQGLSRDDLRILAKREANEERRKRFLDARKRLIGLDVAALDQQVAEKQRMKQHEKDMEKLERQRALEIQRILDGFTEEENNARLNQKKTLMSSWKNCSDEKRNHVPESSKYRPEESSLPSFSGEDIHHDERIKLQKDQMKRWIQEQTDLKVHQKMLEKNSDERYNDMMRAISDLREAAEKEEQDMRKYMTMSIKEQNLELAKAQRDQRRRENHIFDGVDRTDILTATTLQISDEDNTGVDEYGRILRRDMFRGYTDAQRQRILLDNENLVKQKRQMQEEERRYNEGWAQHDAMLYKAMEANYQEEIAMRDAAKQQQTETLRQQIIEQQEARKLSDKLKRGNIGPEFFSNFGTSCR